MPEVYFPENVILEKLKALLHGFLLVEDNSGIPVLIIKFDAGVLTNIISGCRLELVACHPEVCRGGILLIVHDSALPLFVLNMELMVTECEIVPSIIPSLLREGKIRIALFNEAIMPVYTSVIEISTETKEFDSWKVSLPNIEKIDSLDGDEGKIYPVTAQGGFRIGIKNLDHSENKMLQILLYEDDQMNNLTAKYSFSDFLGHGRHGYNQEFSLGQFFSQFFDLSKDLFIAPKKANGTEFADFVVLLDDTYLLIESKFVISDKQTKIAQQFTKAVKQLKVADELICSRILELQDERLKEELEKRNFNIRMCIFNDRLNLSEKKLWPVINSFEKIDLPYFISVSCLKEMIVSIYKLAPERFGSNLKHNLILHFLDHQRSDAKVMVIMQAGG